MTRTKFEQIESERGFDYAMEELCTECDGLTTYDNLKEFAIHQLENDNVFFAIHILSAIYNSYGMYDWFLYDYTAGTTCTPRSIDDIDDVEEFIGFDLEPHDFAPLTTMEEVLKK